MVEWSDNCQAKTHARQDFSKTEHIKGPLGLKKMKVGYWEYCEVWGVLGVDVRWIDVPITRLAVGPAVWTSRGPSIDFWALSQIAVKLRKESSLVRISSYSTSHYSSPFRHLACATLEYLSRDGCCCKVGGSSFIPPSQTLTKAIWRKALEHRLVPRQTLPLTLTSPCSKHQPLHAA